MLPMFAGFDATVIERAQQAQPPVESPQQQQEFEGGLTVTYLGPAEWDLSAGRVVFTGGVRAEYGITAIEAPILVVNYRDRTGMALGSVEQAFDRPVRILDPEAVIQADSVNFDWGKHTGIATDVLVESGHLFLWADQMEIEPGLWTFTEARVTLDRRIDPRYELTFKELRIRPGDEVVGERIRVAIFGAEFGTISSYTIDLDPRSGPIEFPSIKLDPGGFGIGLKDRQLLSDDFGYSAAFKSVQGDLPTYKLAFVYSPIRPQAALPLGPRNDLGERFDRTWFDTVKVVNAQDAIDKQTSKRLNAGVATAWNVSERARPGNFDEISTSIELFAEMDTNDIGLPGWVDFRFQRIRATGGSEFLSRFTARGSFLISYVPLGDTWRWETWFDAFGSSSQRGAFGWVRALTGFRGSPIEGLTLGAGVAIAEQGGDPDFLFDTLFFEKTLHLRADWTLGPYGLSVLRKADLDSGEWFDTEVMASIVAGGLVPYVMWREFPREFQFGVRFRIGPLVERLRSGDLSRDQFGG